MQTEDIDVRSLRCFVAVAEELHFGKAAQRLNMSQPPLTKRIQALERHLASPLFDRSTRQVALTPAGLVLLREARQFFAQSEAMKRALRRVGEERAGTLRIGFISSSFIAAIQPQLPILTEELGPVEYVWRELSSAEQARALQRHELDIGFVHTPADHHGLSSFVLMNEPCLVAMSDTHRLAARDTVDLAELRSEAFVLFPREIAAAHFDRIIAACQAAGFSPDLRHQVRHFLTMLLLPASGCGVSIVPASARRIALPGLRLQPLTGTALRAELTVLWHPENQAPLLKRMLGLLRSGFAADGG